MEYHGEEPAGSGGLLTRRDEAPQEIEPGTSHSPMQQRTERNQAKGGPSGNIIIGELARHVYRPSAGTLCSAAWRERDCCAHRENW